LVLVFDVREAGAHSFPESESKSWNRTAPSTWGLARDAHAQTVRTSAFHQRKAERSRCAALLRRDEGCARPALEVRYPPADYRARGTRLHTPPAHSRPADRGDQAARA